MQAWLFFTLATLLFWSLQAILLKIGFSSSNVFTFLLLNGFFSLALAVPISFLAGEQLEVQLNAFLILALLFSLLGFITYVYALRSGEVSVVVALTSLYVLVTAVLSFFFLKEPFTLKKMAGAVLATLAVILLSL